MDLPVAMKVAPGRRLHLGDPADARSRACCVPARLYASETLLAGMDAGVFEQVTNVACLPGIVRAALCMPDGHWGYGFPIGGVAAFRADTGVISPGGIGFDINCGMRVLRTSAHRGRGPPAAARARRRALRGGADGRRRARLPPSRAARVPRGDGRGRGLGRAPRLRAARGPRGDRRRRLPARRRSRRGQRARAPPRHGPARHAGLRQSLPRDPGRPARRRARARGRARVRHHRPRAGARDAPLRLARVRSPGRHRLPAPLRPGHARATASPCATASSRARRSARPRARRTSAR